MGAALNFNIGFTNVGGCPTCGAPVVLTNNMERCRREDGKYFYCPSGHAQSFGKTTVDVLEEKLAKENRRREWAEQRASRFSERLTIEERRSAAYKGHLNRTKRRVGNGVCPCCNRTFKDLMRHMGNKHPDYKDLK